MRSQIQRRSGLFKQIKRHTRIHKRAKQHVAADAGEALQISDSHGNEILPTRRAASALLPAAPHSRTRNENPYNRASRTGTLPSAIQSRSYPSFQRSAPAPVLPAQSPPVPTLRGAGREIRENPIGADSLHRARPAPALRGSRCDHIPRATTGTERRGAPKACSPRLSPASRSSALLTPP